MPRRLVGCEVDEFHRLNGLGHFDGDRVGVQAEAMAFAVVADRRDHRDDLVLEHLAEHDGIDPLDSARPLVVDAAEDAGRVGDEEIAGGPAEVVVGKALENMVRHAVGGRDAGAQRGRIRDAGAVAVR